MINQIGRKRLIVLDYEANAGESIRKTLGPFIDILRAADEEIAILVISKIRYAEELHNPGQLKSAQARAKFQEDLVKARRVAGDSNIHFLDGGSLLGEHADEGTVDGVHPTAFGFMKMANAIEPAIKEILK